MGAVWLKKWALMVSGLSTDEAPMRYVLLGSIAAATGVVVVVAELMHGADVWRRYSGLRLVVPGLLLVSKGLAKH
jgi:hypothetical protein